MMHKSRLQSNDSPHNPLIKGEIMTHKDIHYYEGIKFGVTLKYKTRYMKSTRTLSAKRWTPQLGFYLYKYASFSVFIHSILSPYTPTHSGIKEGSRWTLSLVTLCKCCDQLTTSRFNLQKSKTSLNELHDWSQYLVPTNIMYFC